jgi:hypothetical protein
MTLWTIKLCIETFLMWFAASVVQCSAYDPEKVVAMAVRTLIK